MGTAPSTEAWVVLPDGAVRRLEEPTRVRVILDEFPNMSIFPASAAPIPGVVEKGDKGGSSKRVRMRDDEMLMPGQTYMMMEGAEKEVGEEEAEELVRQLTERSIEPQVRGGEGDGGGWGGSIFKAQIASSTCCSPPCPKFRLRWVR